MQLTGSNPVAREDPSLLECCYSAAAVTPEMTSEQSEWCRPRGQRTQRANRSGVAEQIVLMTWIGGNWLFFLQFSFQQGGWGASLADMLVR